MSPCRHQRKGIDWRHLPPAALLAALSCVATGTARSAEAPGVLTPPAAATHQAGTWPAALPSYRSMFPDAALSRVGSVTRGSVGAQDMMVLAPKRKGAAATDQPVLSWYLPGSSGQQLELVLQEHDADEPLLEVQLASRPDRQVASLALADHGVRLRPGVEYEWSVALVADPERRSHDVFSMGTVQYVPPGAELSASLEQLAGTERVTRLLASGYWYDTIELLETGAAAGDQFMAHWQQELLRGEGLLADKAARPEVPIPGR